VLSNLLENALKYTPEDRPVQVTVEPLRNRVRVSVIDHGEGISKEQQADLFKPFTRGRTDREERVSGLGLGLSVCRGIVELHGGTIGVVSELGAGSTFYFELPRKATG
jgi:signal transduction histidine kinase